MHNICNIFSVYLREKLIIYIVNIIILDSNATHFILLNLYVYDAEIYILLYFFIDIWIKILQVER